MSKKRIIKQITLFAACASINAYAVAPGFYMGLGFGPATNNAKEATALTTTTPPTTVVVNPKSQQFASRIFMGNKINSYAGFEWGGTFYSGINYDDKGQPLCSGAVARVRDIELLAVGYLPTADWPVDFFGKAGVAYAYTSTSGGLNCTATTCGKTTYTSKWAPIFGFGAGYNWNQNWVSDVSLNTLLIGGQISRVSSIMVSLSYHFVNTYCGQFLCD